MFENKLRNSIKEWKSGYPTISQIYFKNSLKGGIFTDTIRGKF